MPPEMFLHRQITIEKACASLLRFSEPAACEILNERESINAHIPAFLHKPCKERLAFINFLEVF